MPLKFISIFIFVLSFLPGRAQDAVYSQFMHNPIYYNPAYTGLSEGLRIRSINRKQWPNLPGDYRSYNFNMDIATRNIKGFGGIGLMFDKNIAGSGYFERIKIGIPISFRVQLLENLIVQLGGMGSFVQKSIDWRKLVFVDQLDPRFGNIYSSSFAQPGSDKITYTDADIGLAFRWVTSSYRGGEIIATAGVAVQHVFTPNESLYQTEEALLPRKLVITADVIIKTQAQHRSSNYNRTNSNNEFRLNPGFIFESQKPFRTASIGVNAYKSSVYLGFWFRNESFNFESSNSAIIMAGVGIPVNDDTRVKIVYSYDMVLTKSNMGFAGGSHEISIIFELDSMIPFSNNSRYRGNNLRNQNRNSALECRMF